MTGASNVTGWIPPVAEICAAAHERAIPVLLDAAQLAPHRPLPDGPDYLAFSGHKLYAPFGAGASIGPRETFMTGDPFLAGGGAVDLVDLDEVIWSDPPEREEAGSPNVVGAVAFGAALDEVERLGWGAIEAHESALSARLFEGLRAIDGVRLLGPWATRGAPGNDGLAVATFTLDGMHHAFGGGPAERRVRCGRPPRVLLLPTRTCSVCSVSAPKASTAPVPPCSAVTAAPSPAPSGPAAGWARRERTSMRCSRRSEPWSAGRRRPCPMPRTPSRATSGPRGRGRLGGGGPPGGLRLRAGLTTR